MASKHLIIFGIITLLLTACTPHNEGASYLSTSSNMKVAAGIGAGVGVGGAAIAGASAGGIIAAGAVGAGIGALVGYHMRTPGALLAELRIAGMQVIELGYNVRIILPADQFFEPVGTEIDPSRYPILNRLAMLLEDYGSAPITVAGYTDNVMSAQLNQLLAQQQAQAVANYLRSQGIAWQRLRIKGFGEQPNVATNHTVMGSSDNRRIEIKVRKEHV